MTTDQDTLSTQLQRLRALYLLLSSVPDSRRHDELIEQTRIAIAAVRRTKCRLVESLPDHADKSVQNSARRFERRSV